MENQYSNFTIPVCSSWASRSNVGTTTTSTPIGTISSTTTEYKSNLDPLDIKPWGWRATTGTIDYYSPIYKPVESKPDIIEKVIEKRPDFVLAMADSEEKMLDELINKGHASEINNGNVTVVVVEGKWIAMRNVESIARNYPNH